MKVRYSAHAEIDRKKANALLLTSKWNFQSLTRSVQCLMLISIILSASQVRLLFLETNIGGILSFEVGVIQKSIYLSRVKEVDDKLQRYMDYAQELQAELEEDKDKAARHERELQRMRDKAYASHGNT